ncbi:MAG: carboxypeptidase-like regulatory domain-containing protein, partial [Bacteroidota bacterium]
MKKNKPIKRVLQLVCMLAFFLPLGLFAQVKVSGIVLDKDKEPLIGVSILVKNTVQGTVTDVDGSYSLAVQDANATLVFSYTGFTSQEIALGGRTKLDVSLEADQLLLDEVIVVGYGIQK